MTRKWQCRGSKIYKYVGQGALLHACSIPLTCSGCPDSRHLFTSVFSPSLPFLQQRIDELNEEAEKLLGKKILLGSPLQVSKVNKKKHRHSAHHLLESFLYYMRQALSEQLGLKKVSTTNEDTLSEIDHPLAKVVACVYACVRMAGETVLLFFFTQFVTHSWLFSLCLSQSAVQIVLEYRNNVKLMSTYINGISTKAQTVSLPLHQQEVCSKLLLLLLLLLPFSN